MKKHRVMTAFLCMVMFTTKQSYSQTTLEKDCLQTLGVMSRAIINLPFADGSRIGDYWRAVGVRPSSINSNMGSSNLRRLVDPREYVPSTDQARRMCLELQEDYGDIWGITFTAQNQEKKVSFAVFETDEQERDRIPGTWAIYDGDLRAGLRNELKTLSVTYRLEENRQNGTETCHVFFSVLPEHVDFQLISSRVSVPENILVIYNYAAFHIPVLAIAAQDGSNNLLMLYYIGDFNRGNDQILRIVNQNYAAFDNSFDWGKLESELSDLNRTSSNIVLRERSESYQRDNHPIAQNPACVRALGAAREDYARSAR